MFAFFIMFMVLNLILNFVFCLERSIENPEWLIDMMAKSREEGLSILDIMFMSYFWGVTLLFYIYYLYKHKGASKFMDKLKEPRFFKKG